MPDFAAPYIPRERNLSRDEYTKLLAALDLVVMRAGNDVGSNRKRAVDELRVSKRPRSINRRLWVAVAVGLGMRRSEVESLDWSGIDLKAAVLRNQGTKTKGSDRITPIPAELLAELLKVPESQRVGRGRSLGERRP